MEGLNFFSMSLKKDKAENTVKGTEVGLWLGVISVWQEGPYLSGAS